EWTPREVAVEVFGTHWSDESWQEVLLLVAGTINEEFAGEVIDYLLRGADPFWRFAEPPVPRNVELAFRCLAELRTLTAVARQAEAALMALTQMFEDKVRYWLPGDIDAILSAIKAVGPR